MPSAKVGAIDLEYEVIGDPARPAVLLVSGLGSQLIGWTDGLCEEIASRGFQVIRFDNRDVGLSTKLPDGPPYSLSDMSADAAGLLDALGIRAAHVVGASMGGMIAQLVAIEHPEKVLSLTIVMSSLGGDDQVFADAEVMRGLVAPEVETREERIRQTVETARLTWGPSFDEERSRARATRAVDRSHYPAGALRQGRAMAAAPSRREALERVRVPVLVIHGDGDPLVPFANARLIADAVPAAELYVMRGVGHEMPPWEWPAIADRIARLAGVGERSRTSTGFPNSS